MRQKRKADNQRTGQIINRFSIKIYQIDSGLVQQVINKDLAEVDLKNNLDEPHHLETSMPTSPNQVHQTDSLGQNEDVIVSALAESSKSGTPRLDLHSPVKQHDGQNQMGADVNDPENPANAGSASPNRPSPVLEETRQEQKGDAKSDITPQTDKSVVEIPNSPKSVQLMTNQDQNEDAIHGTLLKPNKTGAPGPVQQGIGITQAKKPERLQKSEITILKDDNDIDIDVSATKFSYEAPMSNRKKQEKVSNRPSLAQPNPTQNLEAVDVKNKKSDSRKEDEENC